MMRAVVCDDDPTARLAVTEIVQEGDGEVVAETDRSGEAIDLIERFLPDVVVLDLALAGGSGVDVVEHFRRHHEPPPMVLFTAFDSVTSIDATFVDVVHKPDFALLGHRLRAAAQEIERRRPSRPVPPPRARDDLGVDGPDDFYRVLADASREDTLFTLAVPGDRIAETADILRRSIRVQDRLIRRHDQLAVILVGGGEGAAPGLRDRLRPVLPDIDDRAASTPAGEDPIERFMELIRARTTTD